MPEGQSNQSTIKINSQNVDRFKKSYELPHHWQLRRDFLLTYSDRFATDRLVCLSNVFVNVECMGLSYPEKVMELVHELGHKINSLADYKAQSESRREAAEPPRKQVRRY